MEALRVVTFGNLHETKDLADKEEALSFRESRDCYSKKNFNKIFSKLNFSFLFCYFKDTMVQQAEGVGFHVELRRELEILKMMASGTYLYNEARRLRSQSFSS